MDVEQLQYYSAGLFSGPFSMALFKYTESNIPVMVLPADVLFAGRRRALGHNGGTWSLEFWPL